MSEIEITSAPRKTAGVKIPRHPYHEIADLLAYAIQRARRSGDAKFIPENSKVQVDITGYQSVNANSTQQEGVCK
ncbi:MAG: hypothetical protein ABL856_02070 [Gallionella sp.]